MARRNENSNNLLTLVFGVVVASVGLFSLIRGVSLQFGGDNTWSTILPFYLLGVALLAVGKHFLHSAGVACCHTSK